MSGPMEISVHWRFQVPGEPRERATHANQSDFCLVFSLIVSCIIPSNAVRECVATVRSCGHRSVQMICGRLACKQRVGDAISVKTLVRRSPDLPDLLCSPWTVRAHTPIEAYKLLNRTKNRTLVMCTLSNIIAACAVRVTIFSTAWPPCFDFVTRSYSSLPFLWTLLVPMLSAHNYVL